MIQAQKMESVGQLTGGIAHDFNNMLTVITGTIEILADGVKDNPVLARIVALISDAADRGAKLTANLLAFARKQPLQPTKTDVNALVGEAAAFLTQTLGRQIEIHTNLSDDLWPSYIDPGQLSSALVNLGINARDAMPDGGKLTFTTNNVTLDGPAGKARGVDRPGDYIVVEVTDTGTGIPDAIRDRIFEPFFSTKEIGQGTGLGLSMVFGFAKQSGGNIEVRSEPDRGTSVEHAAGLEEAAVLVEAFERFAQATAHGRDLLQLFLRQVVEVLVHRRTRIDLVLDAVEAGHQHRGEGEIRDWPSDRGSALRRAWPSGRSCRGCGRRPSGCAPNRRAAPALHSPGPGACRSWSTGW